MLLYLVLFEPSAATTTAVQQQLVQPPKSELLPAGFARLAYLVMDEADRLLDPSFEADLRVLLPLLPDPAKRQSLLFSATLTPSLVKLQQASLADAHVFQVGEGGIAR
jgi:hypothetical protein